MLFFGTFNWPDPNLFDNSNFCMTNFDFLCVSKVLELTLDSLSSSSRNVKLLLARDIPSLLELFELYEAFKPI